MSLVIFNEELMRLEQSICFAIFQNTWIHGSSSAGTKLQAMGAND